MREQHGATPVAPPKVPRSDLCRMRTCSECSHYDRAGRFENGQKYCNHTRSEFAYVRHDEPACRYFDEQTSAATTATDQAVARGIVGLRTAFQPKCRHCTDWKRLLPDTSNDPEGGWCEKFSDYRAHYESHECHSELPLEPTNTELDAIEAEESESSTPIGFAGATVELLSESDADAMAAQWDVECAAKDRPTNGLRIESVARELVEVESRRQELIEELGRLVSGS